LKELMAQLDVSQPQKLRQDKAGSPAMREAVARAFQAV
jgi:hypothetical protein